MWLGREALEGVVGADANETKKKEMEKRKRGVFTESDGGGDGAEGKRKSPTVVGVLKGLSTQTSGGKGDRSRSLGMGVNAGFGR